MYAKNLRLLFISITIIVIGNICFFRMGAINFHTICATGIILVPATVIMGVLGLMIGDILDHPKNRADADYKVAVLNALKKMDKSITLQELNEKLSKQVQEPDLPNSKDDVDE